MINTFTIIHCAKSAQIRSLSVPYVDTFQVVIIIVIITIIAITIIIIISITLIVSIIILEVRMRCIKMTSLAYFFPFLLRCGILIE